MVLRTAAKGWSARVERVATTWGPWLLVPAAALEASVFPAPTEAIFLACAVGPRRAWWRLMGFTLLGAAIGSYAGWWIGASLVAPSAGVAAWPASIAPFAASAADAYRAHPLLALGLSGFTPIPFAAYTIVAGTLAMPLPTLVFGALLGRSAKYLILSGIAAMVWRVVTQYLGRDRQRFT